MRFRLFLFSLLSLYTLFSSPFFLWLWPVVSIAKCLRLNRNETLRVCATRHITTAAAAAARLCYIFPATAAERRKRCTQIAVCCYQRRRQTSFCCFCCCCCPASIHLVPRPVDGSANTIHLFGVGGNFEKKRARRVGWMLNSS